MRINTNAVINVVLDSSLLPLWGVFEVFINCQLKWIHRSQVYFSSLQVMMALSAHLGSLEAEKQKLRAQVSDRCRNKKDNDFVLFMFSVWTLYKMNLPQIVLLIMSCSPSSFLSFPSLFLRPSASGASSLSGEPVVEGRAGRCSAAAAGQGAGGGHPGGAEQTPAVHVLHTQIRPGGATAGEDGGHKLVIVFVQEASPRIKCRKTSWQHEQEKSALYVTNTFWHWVLVRTLFCVSYFGKTWSGS